MPSKNLYYPELDGLRFFAFLLVFIHHGPPLPNLPFFIALHEYGWMGVDLFLCLSAFLFAKLLFVEYQSQGDINVKNFYIRRALRIWPLYFFFLGGMVLWTIKNAGWDSTWLPRTLGMALFADNLFSVFLGYNPFVYSAHLWTISYEEQFYAVIPWSLRKMFRMDKKATTLLLAAVFALFSLARAALIFFQVPHPAVWVLPIAHFESILGGLAVGLGVLDKPLQRIPPWLTLTAGLISLSLICVLPNVDVVGWHLMLAYPLVGLGTSLVLAAVIGEQPWFFKSFLRNNPPLAYLGKISYGLYVYHLLALDGGLQIALAAGISRKRLLVFPVAVLLGGLCVTILTAAASYQWLEKPFLRLKERFTVIPSRPI